MLHKPNIFNIPANYDFFESLLAWLIKEFPKTFSEVKIFLPNRRSCRQLQEIFFAKKTNVVLPKIKAISDISHEDFFDFLPNAIIDEILQNKVLSGIEYLFFLSHEIQKLSIFGSDLDFNQAFKIAGRLQELFDEIEREEIDLKKLDTIDDSDLSRHRQLTLEFLKEFHIKIKNSLLKKKIFFASSHQNFVINEFAKLIEQQGSKAPIIIAGSTGSVSFSKKLIRSISKQKNGYVVLHGASKDFVEAENHPQFFLSQLIKFLEVEKNSIKEIADEKFLLSDENRQNLLSLMMLPSEETVKWQRLDQFLDVKKVAKDLEKNFKIIEAKNEIEEAKIISSILLESSSQNKKSALVTNNEKLIELVKSELQSNNASFNDSRNIGVFDSALIKFLLLILELHENDFDSHILLSLLKNPLCFFSQEKELLADFEIKILRQDRVKPGLIGIKEKLKNVGDENLNNFFEKFLGILERNPKADSLTNYSDLLIKTAEGLIQKTLKELLENEPAQVEIFEFLEKLKSQNDLMIHSKNLLAFFTNIFAQIRFFEKTDAMAQIQILSTLEARLLNFDLMIVASLNEGDFPQIEGDNWLGKKIKKDLGIEKSAKKLGQNAYDFCNYLSNSEIVLTRSKTSNGSALIESPFLLKFKTLCKKLGMNLSPSAFAKATADKRAIKNLSAPNPKPKFELRPQKISITEISKLISNPYFIYAKKILRLKELQKIDFEPSFAEFGSFVHKALEEFVKNPQTKDFTKIFEKYFISQEAKLIWLPKFEKIFSDFAKENKKFKRCETYAEIPVKLPLDRILISGKIDRVIFDEEGFVEIFDYKTGQLPTKKNVFAGIEPQLTLAALALIHGTIETRLKNIDEEKINSLNYWKLSSSSISKITKISDDNEEIKILLSAAKSGLSSLFKYFENEENGYVATADQKNNEYEHLARTEEWNK